MDMQKEREAFEEWASNKTEITSLVFSLCFDGEYADTFVQFAWEAWQAAKAQAVPDGYVVVPKEPTWEMIDAGENACYGDDEEICKISYKAMIEAAQEQSNE